MTSREPLIAMGDAWRVGTWNVNYRGPVTVRQGEYLRDFELDLVLLQEANPRTLPALVEEAGLDWAICARGLYLHQPAGAMLWAGRGRVEPLDTAHLAQVFGTVAVAAEEPSDYREDG